MLSNSIDETGRPRGYGQTTPYHTNQSGRQGWAAPQTDRRFPGDGRPPPPPAGGGGPWDRPIPLPGTPGDPNTPPPGTPPGGWPEPTGDPKPLETTPPTQTVPPVTTPPPIAGQPLPLVVVGVLLKLANITIVGDDAADEGVLVGVLVIL